MRTYKRQQPKNSRKLEPKQQNTGNTPHTANRRPVSPQDGNTPKCDSYGDYQLRRTARWHKLRRAFVKRHPICRFCDNPTDEVHHIQIPNGDKSLFFSTDNLAPLCSRHHDQVHGAYSRGLSWYDLTGE